MAVPKGRGSVSGMTIECDYGDSAQLIVVVGTFGGHFLVEPDALRPMAMRSEYERVPTSPPRESST